MSTAQRRALLEKRLGQGAWGGHLSRSDELLLEWVAFSCPDAWWGPGMAGMDTPGRLAPWLEVIDDLVQVYGANPNAAAWAVAPPFVYQSVLWTPDPSPPLHAEYATPWLDKRPLSWMNALAFSTFRKPSAFAQRLLEHGATLWPQEGNEALPGPPQYRELRNRVKKTAVDFSSERGGIDDWQGKVLSALLLLPSTPSVPSSEVAEGLLLWVNHLVRNDDVKGWSSVYSTAFSVALNEWFRRAEPGQADAEAYAAVLKEAYGLLEENNLPALAVWQRLESHRRLSKELPVSVPSLRARL